MGADGAGNGTTAAADTDGTLDGGVAEADPAETSPAIVVEKVVGWPSSDLGRLSPIDPATSELVVEECRWLGPARWELDLAWRSDPAPTPQEPLLVVVPVGVGVERPDASEEPTDGISGGYGFLELTIGANGGATGEIDGVHPSVLGAQGRGLWRFQPLLAAPPSGICTALAVGAGRVETEESSVEVTLAPQRDLFATAEGAEGSEAAEPRTMESLAAQVPVTVDWGSHPLAAAAMVVESADVPVDRFHLNRSVAIESIEVELIEGCLVALTTQESGAVLQYIGCEAVSFPGELTEGVALDADGGWTVSAFGSAEFVAGVEPHLNRSAVPVEEAPRLVSPVFQNARLVTGGGEAGTGSGDSLDPYELVGTYRWGEVDVVVTGVEQADYCCPPLEVELVDGSLGGGSQGTACRDWQLITFDDGSRGFHLVAVRGDRSAVLEVDGVSRDIPLEPSNVADLRIAVVDIPASVTDPEARATAASVTVLDPDGQPAPCIQN